MGLVLSFGQPAMTALSGLAFHAEAYIMYVYGRPKAFLQYIDMCVQIYKKLS